MFYLPYSFINLSCNISSELLSVTLFHSHCTVWLSPYQYKVRILRYVQVKNKLNVMLDTGRLTMVRQLLWSRGNIIASHIAGPGSISDRVSFPC